MDLSIPTDASTVMFRIVCGLHVSSRPELVKTFRKNLDEILLSLFELSSSTCVLVSRPIRQALLENDVIYEQFIIFKQLPFQLFPVSLCAGRKNSKSVRRSIDPVTKTIPIRW